MNKIIVTDVDGTLMPSTNIIDSDTKSYLNKLEQDGNIVVLASGRGYHELSLIHQALELKGPIISSNGGSLNFFDKNQDVVLSINPLVVKEIFKENKEVIISAYYSYLNDLYIYNKLNNLSFLYKINENSIIHEGDYDKLDLKNPNSIYFILDNSRKQIFYDYVLSKYNDEIDIEEYGHDMKYSITILKLKHTNKAYAILELLMILNKKEEDLIIFGDEEQDKKMLSLNGLTFAMQNAPDDVRKIAKYTTTFDNNNKGVLFELKKIFK